VWTNLGYLYLRLDDAELANQCFLKTQIMDPDLAQAWLGQGFLAEQNGDTEHARALFAHSVTLSAGSLVSAIVPERDSAFITHSSKLTSLSPPPPSSASSYLVPSWTTVFSSNLPSHSSITLSNDLAMQLLRTCMRLSASD